MARTRKTNGLTLTQAVNGFLLEKSAQQLSPHTIADYTVCLKKFLNYVGEDIPLSSITMEQVNRFLTDLATPRAPAGIAARAAKPLSKKTILNHHTALSALWTWALRQGFVAQHLLHDVPRPHPEQRAVQPLTEEEVKALLRVCERSATYKRPGKKPTDHRRVTGLRDRAIILLLLDTGMRASELCDLRIHHVDLKARTVAVFGKGDKERILHFCAATGKAIWQYLVQERKEERVDAPLFVSHASAGITRSGLRQLLDALGERAGVAGVHPHRFRHTYAVNFLRNGGNIYALQESLGHTTLDMVKTYLQLAQADLEAAHRQASPVENWRL